MTSNDALPWDEPAPFRNDDEARAQERARFRNGTDLADDVRVTATRASTRDHRRPYVGQGAAGARRSAQIDREEIDGLDRVADEGRIETLESSATRWDAQADEIDALETAAAMAEETAPSTAELLKRHAVEVGEIDGLLDRYGPNPTGLLETARQTRDRVIDSLTRRAKARRDKRPQIVKSATDLRREASGLADDADVLAALGGALVAGAEEARLSLGELMLDLPDGNRRRTMRVGDGHGTELVVKREPRTELSAQTTEIVDVLVAQYAGQVSAGAATDNVTAEVARERLAAYREGMHALLALLSSRLSWKSTALDALVVELEQAEEDDLARRLRKAYARVEKGDPRVSYNREQPKARNDRD